MQSVKKQLSTHYFKRLLVLCIQENCRNLAEMPCAVGGGRMCLLPLALCTILHLWTWFPSRATCHHQVHCTISCTTACWGFHSLQGGGRKIVSSKSRKYFCLAIPCLEKYPWISHTHVQVWRWPCCTAGTGKKLGAPCPPLRDCWNSPTEWNSLWQRKKNKVNS